MLDILHNDDKLIFLLEYLTLKNINEFDFQDNERLEKIIKSIFIKLDVYDEIKGYFV